MTESLHDDDAKTTLHSETPRLKADDPVGFWGREASDGLDMPLGPEEAEEVAFDDAHLPDEPTLSDAATLSDDSAEADASPWLSLSRTVETRSSRRGAASTSQATMRDHPMMRGGRVVVRGPVEGLPSLDYEECLADESMDKAQIPPEASLDAVGRSGDADHVVDASGSFGSVDNLGGADNLRVVEGFDADLDEPPMLDDEPVDSYDPYLPPDVYVEENPYDLAMAETDEEVPARNRKSRVGLGQVWLDAEYEVLGDEAPQASAIASGAEIEAEDVESAYAGESEYGNGSNILLEEANFISANLSNFGHTYLCADQTFTNWTFC